MLSVADLRARNVRPVWQEAVAVVQELIQSVLAADGALPDLQHVALIPNGDVVALPGGSTAGNPVRNAAVMLRVLLDGSAIPPELDAFVTRNTSESPQCSDLGDFARNLSFYERPGRRADVERLVERAMAAEQNTRAEEELQRLKERTLDATVAMEAPPDMFAVPERRRSPVPALALGVLLLIILVAVPVWWWRTRAGAPQPPDASQSAGAATAAPAEGTPDAGAAPAPDAAASAAPAATPAAAPAAPAAPAAGGQPEASLLERTTAAVKSAVSQLVSAATPTEVIPGPPPAPPAPEPRHAARRTTRRLKPIASTRSPAPAFASVAPAAPPSEPVPAALITPEAPPPPPDETVYSAGDAGVIAPVLVRPVLPKEPPPGLAPDQIGTMEVLVDEQGDVEAVKLVSPANRFHERMLVSAAKMWKFRPAFKDGHPVRYLARVRLTI